MCRGLIVVLAAAFLAAHTPIGLSYPAFKHSKHNFTISRDNKTDCVVYNYIGYKLIHYDDTEVKYNGQNSKNTTIYHTLGHCDYINEVDYDPQRKPEYIPLRLCLTKCSAPCVNMNNSDIEYYCQQIYKVHTIFVNEKKEEKPFPSDCLCVSANRTNSS